MAKSRTTFNKKEKEKNKLKKRQDKEEKKDARKANAKSSSFEDMIAYVDENGNLSSTPPDPLKKKNVSVESIQIGISKQADIEAGAELRTGVVTFFNDAKGYGFIKDPKTQESFFVHRMGLIDEIKEKDKVSFDIERTVKGYSAIHVKRV